MRINEIILFIPISLLEMHNKVYLNAAVVCEYAIAAAFYFVPCMKRNLSKIQFFSASYGLHRLQGE